MRRIASGIFLVVLVTAASPAQAGVGDWVDFSGYVQSDLRYVIERSRGARGDGYRFEMNRNDLDLRLEIVPTERLQAVLDTRLRFYGFNHAAELPDLTYRRNVDPYELLVDEAYVTVRGAVWSKLDLSVGRMVRTWGTADQFNPTDNLSARDFSDPLDYAAKVPNQMVELTAYPARWLTLSATWVPVFKPSMLPPSASFGFAVENDANGCFKSAPIPPLAVADVKELGELFTAIPPCDLNFVAPRVNTLSPSTTFENSQVAVKAALQAWEIDVSLSYYYGRFSFPVAYTAVADVTSTPSGAFDVAYTAEVLYPRMQVLGADFTWPLDFTEWFDLDDDVSFGFFGEAALIFPEKVVFGLRAYQDGALVVDKSHVNVSPDPFVKATLGLDTTLPWGTYLNLQYVRGFFDEFADMYGLHNFGVAAVEQKWLGDELQVRVATMVDLNDHSVNVYPQLTWVVTPGVEVAGGTFLFLGDTAPADPYDYASKSRFGQKAAGRNVAFVKVKGSW